MDFKGSKYTGYVETWTEFQRRPEHKNLPIMEIKHRYINHQLLVERNLSMYYQQLNWINSRNKAKHSQLPNDPLYTDELELTDENGNLISIPGGNFLAEDP